MKNADTFLENFPNIYAISFVNISFSILNSLEIVLSNTFEPNQNQYSIVLIQTSSSSVLL